MDEEETRPKLTDWPPKSIEHLSVEALEAYRQALDAEIRRVERTIEARNRHRNAANALFKR